MSFPEYIQVSGFTFFMHGWNRKYYKSSRESDGCPVYLLDPYMLYWVIPIIGMMVYRENGIWRLKMIEDCLAPYRKKSEDIPQSDPFGEYTGGITVSPVDE